MLKREDRINFYPCIAGVPVDASDCTCHKFVAEISCVIIVQTPSKHGNTAACVHIVNLALDW